MALTNQQYDNINRVYEKRRLDNIYQKEQRKKEIYEKIPAFRDLDQQIISISMDHARKLLEENRQTDSDPETLSSLHDGLEQLRQKQHELLTGAGYPADYLDPHYTCEQCHDTGYIDGEKCSCFRKMEVELLYDASQFNDILEKNNFSRLSYDYYRNDDLVLFKHAEETCKNFIKYFDSDYRNLFFYGTVGTGKSFLSACVAKELLDRGKYVIYFSATRLFGNIAATMRDKELSDQLFHALYHSDLLIIDDLGAEYVTDYTCTQLFNLINERMHNRKPVIISTNFTTLEEIREHYSDRVFSRIYQNYELLKLTGTDIRIQQKRESSQ